MCVASYQLRGCPGFSAIAGAAVDLRLRLSGFAIACADIVVLLNSVAAEA